MAVVEDRSAEEERDLAQLEIGALMDTAGVGVATQPGLQALPYGDLRLFTTPLAVADVFTNQFSSKVKP